jgi:hypothetical protein
MAISTYTELQTAVANWLDRDDLGARIPEFISLTEARFNRILRIRSMETEADQDTTAGTRTYNLPTDYRQMRTVHLTTNPITPMSYITPEIMDRIWAGSTSGKPVAYTIKGNSVYLGPAPDTVYTIRFLYYKKIPSLSALVTTNDLLGDAPDVYLYGCLLEAEPFLQNDTRVQLWATAFQQAIADIQEQDEKDRHSGDLRVLNTSGYY